jgi:uncharacterized protein (TIGR02145 family)
MKKIVLTIGVLLILTMVIAQTKNSATKSTTSAKPSVTKQQSSIPTTGTFTDERDGNTYNWVRIGKQVWMAENLAYSSTGVVPSYYESKTQPFRYLYGFDSDSDADFSEGQRNSQVYGVLYNWEAAKAACPQGWHLPTLAEFQQLIDYLGGKDVAGGKMKETGTSHWESPNTGASNRSGFSALPGGQAYNSSHQIGILGIFWSASEYSNAQAYQLVLLEESSEARLSENNKGRGSSVRCIRNY